MNLQEEIVTYFKNQDRHVTVKVTLNEASKTCSIDLKVSGRGLGGLASFKNLKWLSETLKTDDIDIRDEYQNPGCDTCDHGSSTEANIYCKNISV